MIHNLRLQNFRSYLDETFEFTEGVSIIVGPNASGKTNLLEAVLVACQGASYRAKDIDLVSYNAPWARLEAHFAEEERIVVIERQPGERAQKKHQINKQKYLRLPFAKTIPVVLFEPEHLQLLQAGPEKRREFLDDLLEQSVAGFAKQRRDYRRALAQRNRLLKRPEPPKEAELFGWNVRLSELGGQIALHRAALLDRCNKDINTIYQTISDSRAKVRLEYQTKYALNTYSSQLLKSFEVNIGKDRERGYTGDGPHREDFQVILSDHDMRLSASRGEVRTLLLGLKLLEMQIVEETRQKRPILLLDDVFSELDGARRKALTSFLQNYQTFITTTDADIVVQHFMGQCSIIPTQR